MVGAVRNSNRLGHSLPCVCVCVSESPFSVGLTPGPRGLPAGDGRPPVTALLYDEFVFFFGSITDKFVSKAKTDKFVLELLLYYYCNTMQ